MLIFPFLWFLRKTKKGFKNLLTCMLSIENDDYLLTVSPHLSKLFCFCLGDTSVTSVGLLLALYSGSLLAVLRGCSAWDWTEIVTYKVCPNHACISFLVLSRLSWSLKGFGASSQDSWTMGRKDNEVLKALLMAEKISTEHQRDQNPESLLFLWMDSFH